MDRVAILPNQRVGIDDYEDGAGGRLVQADQIREGRVFLLPSGRANGSAVTSARILEGFEVSFGGTPDTTATITRGSGLFPVIGDDDLLTFGLMVGDEGAASQIIDFASAAPSSVQTVYVRAVRALTEAVNRVFWNPSGSPAREFTDNVPTRLTSSWEVAFQASALPPPGSDWVKVGEMTLDGTSSPLSYADYRHFYFEGDEESGNQYAHEWGDGANDRNADRGAYGIQDLHLFVQMVRRQLSDIIDPVATGAPHHHEAVTVGLKQLDDEHKTDGEHGAINADSIDVSGSVAITTDLSVDGEVTGDLQIEQNLITDSVKQKTAAGTLTIGEALTTGTVNIQADNATIDVDTDLALKADNDINIEADDNVGGAGDVTLKAADKISLQLRTSKTDYVMAHMSHVGARIGDDTAGSNGGGRIGVFVLTTTDHALFFMNPPIPHGADITELRFRIGTQLITTSLDIKTTVQLQRLDSVSTWQQIHDLHEDTFTTNVIGHEIVIASGEMNTYATDWDKDESILAIDFQHLGDNGDFFIYGVCRVQFTFSNLAIFPSQV